MPSTSIVVVNSRQRPHERVLLGISVILGISYLATVPAPQSLAALVPSWLVILWAIGLLLSGGVGLAAAMWRGSIAVALEVERAAWLANTGPLLLIGGASFVVNGWRAMFGGSIILAWAIANLARSRQIRREVNALTAPEGEDQ